jgi:hypothetical protein
MGLKILVRMKFNYFDNLGIDRFCLLASSGRNTNSPAKSLISPTVRYMYKTSSDTSLKGSTTSGKSSSRLRFTEPLSLWCLAYPEYLGILRRLTVSSMRKKFTQPFMPRNWRCDGQSNPKGFVNRRNRRATLETPLLTAFKLLKMNLFRVTSGNEYNISISDFESESHNHFPNKNLVSVVRFPCEKTVQRRIIPFSWFMSCTTRNWFSLPRTEAKASLGVETLMKFGKGLFTVPPP